MAASEKNNQYEVYLQHRRQLSDLLADQSSKYDRALFVLASGAIALSITYVEKFSGSRPLTWIWSIVGAWALFLVCLSLLVLSHRTSAKAAQADIRQWDENWDRASHKWQVTKWNRVTELANVASYVSFVLGALLFVVFTFGNLGH